MTRPALTPERARVIHLALSVGVNPFANEHPELDPLSRAIRAERKRGAALTAIGAAANWRLVYLGLKRVEVSFEGGLFKRVQLQPKGAPQG